MYNYKLSPIKSPKIFLKTAQLNSISVSTNGGTAFHFGTTSTILSFFVAPCNEVAKYIYNGTRLLYMGLV